MSGSSSGGALGSSGDTSTMPTAISYRQCLKSSVIAILSETGFSKVDSSYVVDVLFLVPLETSHCRSQPLPADVVVAMAEMGLQMNGLREYALRTARKTLGNPQAAQPPKPISILHTGDRSKRFKTHFIPDYFPELPDSHSFVRTATHKQPITDYESVREKASSQKRDVERALTRFIAKTGKTHSLFKTDDTNLYPLISSDRSMAPESPDLPPYLNALLFKDQIFDEDEREFLPKKRVEKHDPDDEDMIKDEDGEKKPKEVLESESSVSASSTSPSKKEAKSPKDKSESETCSNPYMRLLKMSRHNPISKFKKVPPS
ncbi:TAF8 [Lepeophtheirus salmonis]|uniref:Transcription initiation factor TFIID subunit 8 n=1 Tax=Lepeophtheirus salmonis TaxID=72036 RepID=A0A7R8CQJ5_LEPSM|nr:TAF8 [Lepeophtheirus salmonis]CAF2859903.1 TAF8 [Lepeophtheirus salmonis]